MMQVCFTSVKLLVVNKTDRLSLSVAPENPKLENPHQKLSYHLYITMAFAWNIGTVKLSQEHPTDKIEPNRMPLTYS